MKKLKFRKRYAQKILSGEKVTTIRLETDLRPGDEVLIVAGDEPVAKAVIKSVVSKRVSELTDEDAVRDGFTRKKDLMRALRSIYGEIGEGDEVKIVEFELID